MKLTIIATILSLGASAVSATAVNLFRGTTCVDSDYIKTLNPANGCNKFNVAVEAVDVRTLSGSCTFTVYTDESCTDNPTPAGLDKCVSHSGEWKSFSLDGC